MDASTMTLLTDFPLSVLQFYATAPYPCSYLPERMARSQVATPSHLIDAPVYSELVTSGFSPQRRVHIPPLLRSLPRVRAGARAWPRISSPTARSGARWKRHARPDARRCELKYSAEHYALYLRYQRERHCGGGMDQDSREQYRALPAPEQRRFAARSSFARTACCAWSASSTSSQDGLSSVYTFFDPDVAGASFGTYNILWQIERCRQLDLPYLYLGYWIAQSRKMAYKIKFQPMQGLIDGNWQPLPNLPDAPA